MTIFSQRHLQGAGLDIIYYEKTGLPSEKYLVAWERLTLGAINGLALGVPNPSSRPTPLSKGGCLEYFPPRTLGWQVLRRPSSVP